LVACTSTAVTPTPELETVRLKLSWTHGITYLGFYTAQAQGFYAEEGLRVIVEPNLVSSELTKIPEQVAAGEFEFSVGGGAVVANSQAQGVEVIAFSAILQRSPNAYFALADSGIVTPADFVGLRIAVPSDQAQRNLAQLLASVGLTLDDVVLVQVGFDMTAFYEGEVDAWNGYLNDGVIRARQQGMELVTFPLYEYEIEDTAATLFASQDLIQTRPELAVSSLRATLRGWEWAIDNPTKAVDVMLEIYPELVDERDFHLASFSASIPLIRPFGIAMGSIDCERWLRNERLAVLDSREGLCTTEIFEQVVVKDE
jgi:NitT/TauT family transport system substrate-binding protein